MKTGVYLTVYKKFHFEASHVLPRHPGKCSKLHGHSYRLEVGVCGLVRENMGPESGMVIDFDKLTDMVNELVIKRFDHRHLNDLFENPTAELIANYIFMVLSDNIDEPENTPGFRRVDSVTLWETAKCRVRIER